MKIVINSDKELAHEARERLNQNDGYCPCALERNEDTKCMCKEFRKNVMQGYKGECHCGLYESI